MQERNKSAGTGGGEVTRQPASAAPGAELVERLRRGVTWSDGKPIGAVVGEVNDPVMREAADQLTIYARRVAELEEALAGTVAARDEWLEADDGSNAEVHALARMSRADDKARAALTGEQG